MKIENKYVELKIGKKKVVKHNFFLDSYLKLFIDGQVSTNSTNYYKNSQKKLNGNLYIKIDSALSNITSKSTLSENSFEVRLPESQSEYYTNYSNNNIDVSYVYKNDNEFYYNNKLYTDRSILDGHKIMAVSFNLYTYLDVSEYDLYFRNGEILTVGRLDTIKSDAICSGYAYPYHLSPILNQVEYETPKGVYTAKVSSVLYSVGLGKIEGVMREEYAIGEDIELVRDGNLIISFNVKKGDSSTSGSDNTSRYPMSSLYPMASLHPLITNDKYIILKYKLYYKTFGDELVYTGDEYTMSFYTSLAGKLKVKIKMERG